MSENKALLLNEVPQHTLEQLFQIQTQTPPTPIRNFPNGNKTYNVDLNTRQIEVPKTLSLSRDHKSTVIYFKMDRWYDYMDLTNTVCLIQYYPANKKELDLKAPYFYVVPFFDILSCEDEGKMIFPWVIGDAATQAGGKVEFAIRFYKVEMNEAGDISLVYNLNTIPASTTIVNSFEADNEAMQVEYDAPIASAYENLISQLSNQATKWTIL